MSAPTAGEPVIVAAMDEIGFHSSRALEELERASNSVDTHVARTHLRLAEEHLARMRSLLPPRR
jgi:hypothetical protein